MKRLFIIAEGPSENKFIARVLGPYFLAKNINVNSSIITTKVIMNGPNYKGGDVTYDKLVKEINRYRDKGGLVTTLVDFYGFKDLQLGDSVEILESKLSELINKSYFIPYFQKHDFEALLFSNAEVIAENMNADSKQASSLKRITTEYNNPEDINNNVETAPCKRIERIFPQFQKTVNGVIIAESIGLDIMRSKCPRFDNWIGSIERYFSEA